VGIEQRLSVVARRQETWHIPDYSPDLCWISTTVGRPQPASSVVLGDFPHSQHRPSLIHIGLQLPIIRGVQRRRWNFRKADWASYTLATERSIPLIPVNNISAEESYQRFCGAMQKASRHSIPRGFRPTYTPCLDEECQDLLKQYEESGDPDIVTRCSSPASLGRTDVEDELHALKPEELGTDTPAWCCLTTTQVNSSISQRQCRCHSSHPGC